MEKEHVVIAFVCQKCSADYKVKSDKAGKKTKCPACGEMPTVPAAPPSIFAIYIVVVLLSLAAVAIAVVVGLWPSTPVKVTRTSSASRPSPSKTLKEKFLIVRDGMGESEVTLLLGSPDKRMAFPEVSRDVLFLEYREGSKFIVVGFRAELDRFGSPGVYKVNMKRQEGLE